MRFHFQHLDSESHTILFLQVIEVDKDLSCFTKQTGASARLAAPEETMHTFQRNKGTSNLGLSFLLRMHICIYWLHVFCSLNGVFVPWVFFLSVLLSFLQFFVILRFLADPDDPDAFFLSQH